MCMAIFTCNLPNFSFNLLLAGPGTSVFMHGNLGSPGTKLLGSQEHHLMVISGENYTLFHFKRELIGYMYLLITLEFTLNFVEEHHILI